MFEKMKDLAISLNQVTRWKHHLFFDAMDTKDEDLCEECNESMIVSFYVSNDRSDELKWRPHTGDCCWRNCNYYKHEALDDMYLEAFKMENDVWYFGQQCI